MDLAVVSCYARTACRTDEMSVVVTLLLNERLYSKTCKFAKLSVKRSAPACIGVGVFNVMQHLYCFSVLVGPLPKVSVFM